MQDTKTVRPQGLRHRPAGPRWTRRADWVRHGHRRSPHQNGGPAERDPGHWLTGTSGID